MRLLLDTHALIWMFSTPQRLASNVRSAIEDGAHEIYASAASVWEIALKRERRKLSMPADLTDQDLKAAGLFELPIHWSHLALLEPLPRLHADPFDRLLIAQAMAEQMMLVTDDRLIEQYPIQVMHASD